MPAESPRHDRTKEQKLHDSLPTKNTHAEEKPNAPKVESANRAQKKKEVEAEERDKVQQMEVQGIKDIYELIENADVPLAQKEAWKKLASLDIPRDAKIKVVAVIGDPDFHQDGELPLITEALKTLHPNVDVVYIDNKLPKSLKMVVLEKELKSPSHDVVIPYFSSHGNSRSTSGETRVNAADDDFVVHTGHRKTGPKEITDTFAKMKVDLATDDMMKKYASDLIDPKTHKIKPIPAGTTFSVKDVTVTTRQDRAFTQELEYFEEDETPEPLSQGALNGPSEDEASKIKTAKKYTDKELHDRSERTLHILFHDLIRSTIVRHEKDDDEWDSTTPFDRFGENITMGELAEIQKNAEKNMSAGKKQDWIYIFDNCYSGSAINDEIAEPKSTKAILMSSSETEKSGHDQTLHKGIFMKHLFQMMKDGNPIGESFIRTDLLLDNQRKRDPHSRTQNPKAGIREGKNMIEIGSMEKHNDNDRRIS